MLFRPLLVHARLRLLQQLQILDMVGFVNEIHLFGVDAGIERSRGLDVRLCRNTVLQLRQRSEAGLDRGEGIVTLTYVGRREDLCGRFGSIMQHVERMSPAAKF